MSLHRTPKIKVLFQVNELSYSGTTKAVLSFCRFLDRSRFEPFLFHKGHSRNLRYRRHQMEALFSSKARFRFEERYLISQARAPEFETLLGDDHISSGNWKDFKKFVQKIQPEIIHFSRGDESDWYTDKINELSNSIAIVETSIFGKPSTQEYMKRLDMVFVITAWLKSKSRWMHDKGRSLYMPILIASHQKNLRAKLGISDSELIVGRVSRPGLDSGEEVLNIFKKIKSPCRLLFLGGGPALVEEAKINDRIIGLPSTTHDDAMSEFYNSLDVLLHYRKEGETFGMSIADAMIHGKPTVSHRSFLDNAQAELLAVENMEDSQPCGFVVAENDFTDHAEKIDLLLMNPQLRAQMGKSASLRAHKLFDAEVVTKKLEKEYLDCLRKKAGQMPGMTLPPQTGI